MENEFTEPLLQAIAAGDRDAFRRLFDAYSPSLFHLAYSYLHSKELAEEAVLDVFAAIWKKHASLAHIKEIKHYLYTSVKNQSLHYIRRNYLSEKDSFDLYEIELFPEKDTPEDILLNREYECLIQEAINSLPPKCREVFRLVLSDKLKIREIAALMEISEKTVNEHISLAYKKIAIYINKRYK